MKAIVIEQYGGPEQLAIQEISDPEPLPGHVIVEVKAFGLNHAEMYFRKGAWGDVAKVSGIECVGVVKSDRTAQFAIGQKVAALMGGMGRTFNGSYAQLTRVPACNVVPFNFQTSLAGNGRHPRVLCHRLDCLHRNLALKIGQVVLVRGLPIRTNPGSSSPDGIKPSQRQNRRGD